MAKYTVTAQVHGAMGYREEVVFENVSDVHFPAGCLFITFADSSKTVYAPNQWYEVGIDLQKATS